MGKLDGRIALITGGDHGIGLVTAKEFVKEGAYVFITGCSDSRLAAAVKEIEAKELHRTSVGRNVASVQGDVSNAGDLDRVFAQIEREKGKLDVVVAATGETMSDNLAERSLEFRHLCEWDVRNRGEGNSAPGRRRLCRPSNRLP